MDKKKTPGPRKAAGKSPALETGDQTIAFGSPEIPGEAGDTGKLPDSGRKPAGGEHGKDSTQPTIMFQKSDQKPAELPIKRLGEYVLERRLGAGGMGEVFLARQESLDRQVALKILPKEVAQDQELIERFYREARSAAKLIHPNVVQMYFVGQEAGHTFFAMEFVEGEDLSHRLRRGENFTLEEALNIVASVCMALSVAAEQSIVHRDIKPANIMIDKNGMVKVMDFGLAKATTAASHITQAGFVLGTPTYMSPEQGEGKHVDGRSDIYSLGVVLFELLTGKPPFQSDNPASLIYQHIHNEPMKPSEVNPAIPEEVDQVVMKALAKKADDRYASAEEFLEDVLDVKENVRGGTQATIIFDAAAARDMTIRTPRRTIMQQAGSDLATGPATGAVTPAPQTSYVYAPAHGSGVVTVAASVILVLIVLGSVGFGFRKEILGYLQGPEQGGGPGGRTEPGAVKTGGGGMVVETPPPPLKPSRPDAAILSLYELRSLIPGEGVTGSYTSGGVTKPIEFRDVEVEPGKVTLRVERRGYKPFEVEVECTSKGVKPPFTREMFKLEPSEALVAAYKKAAELINSGTSAEGLRALADVEALDPAYERTPELRRKAEDAIRAENQRYEALWQQALDAFKARKFEDAKKRAEEIPGSHAKAREALDLIDRCSKSIQEAKKAEINVADALSKGLFPDARKSLLDLEAASSSEAAAKFLADITNAEALKARADAAMGSGKYDEAIGHLNGLAKICTASEAIKKDIERCNQILKTEDVAQRLVLQIEGRLDNLDFEEALKLVKKLDEASPGHPKLAAMKERAEVGWRRKLVVSTLASIDQATVALDASALLQNVHPMSERLRETSKESIAGITECGARVARSVHTVEDVLFAENTATAKAVWEVELAVPDVGVSVTAKLNQSYTMKLLDDRWLVFGSKDRGGDKTSATGGGEEDKRIRGSVTKVERDLVTIDRGKTSGVAEKMIFSIYADAKALKLPLSDSVVLVKERLVATARVVRVEEQNCTASIVSREQGAPEPAEGMLAVHSPDKEVPSDVPQVVSAKATPSSAPMGAAAKIALDVANVDRVAVHYVWQADGGRMEFARTAQPSNAWTAPAKAGEYTVTVTLVAADGRSRPFRMKMTGEGPQKEKPKNFAVSGSLKPKDALFEELKGLTFDESGDAFLLDERVVTRLDRHLRAKGVSEPCKVDYSRIAAFGGNLFLLDSRGCEVHRYPVAAKKLLEGAPQAVYGGRGDVNGKFAKPVDMAVNSKGELLVLDGEKMLVHLFDSQGRFVYSFGSGGTSIGELSAPIALAVDSSDRAYVLDAKRLKVLVFNDARFVSEFPIEAGGALDVKYERTGDCLLVLYGGEMQCVQGYGLTGKKLPTRAFGAFSKDEQKSNQQPAFGKLIDSQWLVTDSSGYCYVAGGTGTRLDRFEVSGAFAGRIGGLDLSGASSFAVAPSGEVLLLDGRSGLIRRVDPDGWVMSAFGGTGTKPEEFRTPADMRCDADGDTYVLDSGNKTVYKFSPAGKLVSTIGKAGRKAEDGLMSSVAALAVKSPRLAVGQDERSHAVHVFGTDGTAQMIVAAQIQGLAALALDSRGCAHVATRKRTIESFTPEGRSELRWQEEFRGVKSMDCGPEDYVHVLDSSTRTLYSADPSSGKTVFLTFKLPESFRSPSGLAADFFGGVWVMDDSSKEMIRFEPRR